MLYFYRQASTLPYHSSFGARKEPFLPTKTSSINTYRCGALLDGLLGIFHLKQMAVGAEDGDGSVVAGGSHDDNNQQVNNCECVSGPPPRDPPSRDRKDKTLKRKHYQMS